MTAASPNNPLGLTDRQRLFCHEYVRDFNVKRAAMATGSNEGTASSVGSSWLSDVKVQAYLQLVHRRQIEAVDIRADRVLEEIAKLSFFDLNATVSPAGEVLPIKQWPYGCSAAVSAIEVHEVFRDVPTYSADQLDEEGEPLEGAKPTKQRTLVGFVKKVKFWSKTTALEMLMKHLGQYELDNLQRRAGVGEGDTPRLMEVKAALAEIFKRKEVDHGKTVQLPAVPGGSSGPADGAAG